MTLRGGGLPLLVLTVWFAVVSGSKSGDESEYAGYVDMTTAFRSQGNIFEALEGGSTPTQPTEKSGQPVRTQRVEGPPLDGNTDGETNLGDSTTGSSSGRTTSDSETESTSSSENDDSKSGREGDGDESGDDEFTEDGDDSSSEVSAEKGGLRGKGETAVTSAGDTKHGEANLAESTTTATVQLSRRPEEDNLKVIVGGSDDDSLLPSPPHGEKPTHLKRPLRRATLDMTEGGSL